MALSRSLFASLLLVSSLLAIVSANNSYNNHDQDTKYVDDNHNYDELHKKLEKMIRHSYRAQHGRQSEQGYQHSSPKDVKTALPEGHENVPAETSYVQKSAKSDNRDYQSHDGVNYIEFRGTIQCKSGASSYNAIPGAIAKITCPGWNENGYEYAPFYILSATDKHGFFYATYPVSKLPKNDWTQLVKGCQVIPEYSPLGICNVPFPNGGSHVSYSRIAGDKAYYNAGSLFYTLAESSQDYPKDASLPAGAGY